jgi:hypothetical protein
LTVDLILVIKILVGEEERASLGEGYPIRDRTQTGTHFRPSLDIKATGEVVRRGRAERIEEGQGDRERT